VRSIVAQCQAASVPVFVKQLGAKPRVEESWSHSSGFRPLTLKDRKGGAMHEWPSDIQIRQFPEASA